MNLRIRHLNTVSGFRIIPGGNGIGLPAEELVAAGQRGELQSLLAMSSDFARDEIGQLALIRNEDRQYDQWATPVSQAMTGAVYSRSRASDGGFRVIYMSLDRRTEIIATSEYYSSRFKTVATPHVRLHMTMYRFELDGEVADATGGTQNENTILAQAREAESLGLAGILFDGPTGSSAPCLALMRTNLIRHCDVEDPVIFAWDGRLLHAEAEALACLAQTESV